MVGFVSDPDDPYKLTEDTRALGLVVCRCGACAYSVPHFLLLRFFNSVLDPECFCHVLGQLNNWKNLSFYNVTAAKKS
jgi:hypothetical protein